MYPTAHPEVLAREWLPPVALGREAEVAELVRRLDPPRPTARPPWVVGVVGPAGSGTSTVARRAARDVADRLRQSGSASRPRVLAVRTTGVRGTHGVATALLRQFDEGFEGRGFPVAEVLAGFLRRLRRQGEPAVLVLDDVHVGGPDLSPVLRALANPDRFLPEGEFGIPSVWTLLAGTPDGWGSVVGTLADPSVLGRPVGLLPYSEPALAAILGDRAVRALGRPLSEPVVGRLLRASLEDGGGARRAVDLLRRELLGPGPGRPGGRFSLGPAPTAVEVELRVVRAIEDATQNRQARVGDVRRREAELAHQQGRRPLPATTLWRRIVRLEHAGYVAREVRPGGVGGTRSVLRLLTPVEEWVTSTRHSDTRRDVAGWTDPSWASGTDPPPSDSPPGTLPPSAGPTG